MFKKLAAVVLAVLMVMSIATVFTSCSGGVSADFKIGVILIGDETEGYSKAHIDGIKDAAKGLGVADSQIIWKYKVEENSTCLDAATDLVGQGCDLIISNSYGHQTYMVQAAEQFPDVLFASMTGDFAALTGLPNFVNGFTKVFQSRYVSGVVAGMKVAELLANGTISESATPEHFDNGNVKIGYVGAFTYAEVISGYTSFYLGAKSVCPTVTMDVQFTGSWYDVTSENEAAKALIARDCKLISQHADSMGAPNACEEAGIPNVSYNGSTQEACPNTFIVSSRINWAPYYEYMINQVIKGEEIADDWTGTLATGSVVLTDINENVAAEGTKAAIEDAMAKLKAGELHVFDASTFTVDGKTLTSYKADVDTDDAFTPDTEVIENGVFFESKFRSAPYFDIRIDGITLVNEKF